MLQKAKNKSGSKAVSFDQQLQQLELEKLNIDKKEKEIEIAKSTLADSIRKYNELKQHLENSKNAILKQANDEALKIIASSNKVVEQTIRHIKEGKADKKITKEARNKLSLEKEILKKKNAKTTNNKTVDNLSEEDTNFVAGDWVKVKNSDIVGELISIEGEDALVNVNSVKLRTSKSKLIKTQQFKSSHSGIMHEINKKAINFNLTIDLRGKRADDAMSILKKYIDDALLLNIKEVNILHGKGYGILRDIIREYLQSLEEVAHFGDAPLDMGGSGITNVIFK